MRRDAGYTLIEVLIMLAITALLAATVLETVRATSQNGVRIERAARTATQDFLSMAALRRAIEGTRTEYRGGANVFRGDETGFSGRTATPIVNGNILTQAYSVQLEEDRGLLQLVYEDGAGRFVAAEWPDASGRLRYFGIVAEPRLGRSTNPLAEPQRDWMERWPPPSERRFGATYYESLPLVIELEIVQSSGSNLLIFALPTNGGPPIRPEDVIGSAP